MTMVTNCMVLTTSNFQRTEPIKAASRRSGPIITWSILDVDVVSDFYHQGASPPLDIARRAGGQLGGVVSMLSLVVIFITRGPARPQIPDGGRRLQCAGSS